MRMIRFSVWAPGNLRGPVAQPRPKARCVYPPMVDLWAIARSASSPRALYDWLRKKTHLTIYDPGTARAWRAAVQQEAAKHIPENGPLQGVIEMDVLFHMHRPQNHMSIGRNSGHIRKSAPRGPHGVGKPAGQKPDLDNLLKVLFDGITDAGLWLDDAQLVGGRWRKNWSDGPHQDGCEIEIKAPEHDALVKLAREKAQA